MSQSEHPKSCTTQIRACIQCQKRKSKCTGDTPCAFCAKTHRCCVYAARPSRTPLTRKNLDAAERRCERLTSLLQTLNPNFDVEAMLQRPLTVTGVDDKSPNFSNDFEWNEEPLSSENEQGHSSKDGMALLSTDPSESGYLGSSAGSSMLQTISSLLSLSGRGPLDDPSRNQLSQLIAKRQLSESETLMNEDSLASSLVVDRLIDAYFQFYNSSYPILHGQIFRETYNNRGRISSKSTWHIIFYTVLAIGHWVLSSGDDHADSPYYLAARARMSTEMLESGTLIGVQAFLLMGNYLQKRDRPNTGYNMIGIAFRMALGLGLHREICTNDDQRNTLANEIRRRIWWILYMFDSGFSITMGRPTTASDSFVDVRLPQNVEDMHLTSRELSSPLPPAVDYPTHNSAMISQARLAVIANKIYNEFLASHISNAAISEELAYAFEEQLEAWRTSLPQYFSDSSPPRWFAGPRAVVLWKEQNLRMMLWRGGQKSLKGRAKSEIAIRNCLRVAIETVQAISRFNAEYETLHQGLSWYATYFLFQAVLVLDMGLLQAPDDDFANFWSGAVDQARMTLSQLGITNAAALRCISVLDRIHHHRSKTSSHQPQEAHGLGMEPLDFDEATLRGVNTDFSNHPTYAADPALRFFLDNPSLTNLFDGMSGFPSTQEMQNFDYILGDFYIAENIDMPMTSPGAQL